MKKGRKERRKVRKEGRKEGNCGERDRHTDKQTLRGGSSKKVA